MGCRKTRGAGTILLLRLSTKLARVLSVVLVVGGAAVVSIGVAQMYRPAGVVVAGLAAVLSGLYLIDDGEDVREPSTARPVGQRQDW